MIVSLHLVNFFNLLLMKTSSPISKIHFVKFIYELLVSKYFMDNRLKIFMLTTKEIFSEAGIFDFQRWF